MTAIISEEYASLHRDLAALNRRLGVRFENEERLREALGEIEMWREGPFTKFDMRRIARAALANTSPPDGDEKEKTE